VRFIRTSMAGLLVAALFATGCSADSTPSPQPTAQPTSEPTATPTVTTPPTAAPDLLVNGVSVIAVWRNMQEAFGIEGDLEIVPLGQVGRPCLGSLAVNGSQQGEYDVALCDDDRLAVATALRDHLAGVDKAVVWYYLAASAALTLTGYNDPLKAACAGGFIAYRYSSLSDWSDATLQALRSFAKSQPGAPAGIEAFVETGVTTARSSATKNVTLCKGVTGA
jgi:hypothetical protein